jgi:hypothetical protein
MPHIEIHVEKDGSTTVSISCVESFVEIPPHDETSVEIYVSTTNFEIRVEKAVSTKSFEINHFN